LPGATELYVTLNILYRRPAVIVFHWHRGNEGKKEGSTMKRKYIAVGMIVLLIGTGTALLANAQMRHAGFGFGWPHGEQAFLSHLTNMFDLTDAQQTEVKQLWQAEKPTVMPLVQQLAEGHKQMVAATANGAFDEAKVTPIAQKQAQTLTQLLIEKEKMTAKFYTLLTPEQRGKFDRIRQRRLNHIDEFLQRMAASQAK
jgi:Spy/CpxP family protein refolding chaperone